MKETFTFTANDISRLLFNELARLGKVDANKHCGMITRYDIRFGSLHSVNIEITDPIPGAQTIT